jgi:predicted alpha/beta-hydrolase family hydrolase
VEIGTSEGPARAEVDQPAGGEASFLLVLTHGAGGGVGSPDLLAVAGAASRLGGVVARVTQPYLVKGRRAPGSADRQDAAWVERVAVLRPAVGAGLPLIQGGRSNGARVACRTAAAVGARAVIALAFPLHPPGRPDRSRAAELAAARTDVLVVNGDRDPFGVPESTGKTRVVVLAGESHALSRRPGEAGRAVEAWLREVLAANGAAG